MRAMKVDSLWEGRHTMKAGNDEEPGRQRR